MEVALLLPPLIGRNDFATNVQTIWESSKNVPFDDNQKNIELNHDDNLA